MKPNSLSSDASSQPSRLRLFMYLTAFIATLVGSMAMLVLIANRFSKSEVVQTLNEQISNNAVAYFAYMLGFGLYMLVVGWCLSKLILRKGQTRAESLRLILIFFIMGGSNALARALFPKGTLLRDISGQLAIIFCAVVLWFINKVRERQRLGYWTLP